MYLRSALPGVMKRYNIDKQRVALSGFSDGATMALSLLPLGSVASHIIALSPGGFAPPLVVSDPQQGMHVVLLLVVAVVAVMVMVWVLLLLMGTLADVWARACGPSRGPILFTAHACT